MLRKRVQILGKHAMEWSYDSIVGETGTIVSKDGETYQVQLDNDPFALSWHIHVEDVVFVDFPGTNEHYTYLLKEDT